MCETTAQAVATFRVAAEHLQNAIRDGWAAGSTPRNRTQRVSGAWDRFAVAALRLRAIRPFKCNDLVRRISSTEVVMVRYCRLNPAGNGWYVRTVRASGEAGYIGPSDKLEMAVGAPTIPACTWTHATVCDARYDDQMPAWAMTDALAADRAELAADKRAAA